MTATVLSLVLTLGIVLAALKAMSEVLAHRSLFAALSVGALLAARLAVDDPILAATLVLYLAVVIGVAMLIFSMFHEVMIQPIQDLL